jgi:hypothetical protein
MFDLAAAQVTVCQTFSVTASVTATILSVQIIMLSLFVDMRHQHAAANYELH